MAPSQSHSFDWVFPTRALVRGSARSALIWSSLSTLLLCLLLFNLFLIAEVLISRGEVVLNASEVAAFEELTGESVGPLPASTQANQSVGVVRLVNTGVLPAVWNSRNKYWGQAVAAAYQRIPPLRRNDGALIFLIISATVIGLTRSLTATRAWAASMRTAMEGATRLRKMLYRQTLRLGPSDLENNPGFDVLKLFTAEIDLVQQAAFNWVHRISRAPLQIILLTAIALSIHWLLTLQCLIPLAAFWYLVHREQHRYDVSRRLAEDRARSELGLIAEALQKTRLVRGYGMEAFELERFQRNLDRFTDGRLTISRSERASRWLIRALIMFCTTIVLFLVGSKVLMTPEDLTGSMAILLLVVFAAMHRPLESLYRLIGEVAAARHVLEKTYTYLKEIPEVSQAVGAKFLQPLSKSLQFETVSYELPNHRKLLDQLDLKIPAGEITAVVSLDPLEARSLMYLLPRFIEPQAGRILFDGEDVSWVTLESLRAETVYVGGTDPFFTGTVFENISCGSAEYTLQHVTEAAKETHAHNFILKLRNGYESHLGEHGEQLDAGQALRLGLARAMLRNPALLIIEEPNVALDDDAKSLLEDAYTRIARNRTVLFLPARLSTLRRADQIVMLHRGKVEAMGPHSELVKTCQLYRHWEYVRFNEFRHEAVAMV